MKNAFALILALALSLLLCSCGSDEYSNTLKSGLNKYYSGQTMTKQEYNAVKGFNKWQASQTPKTYSAWDK